MLLRALLDSKKTLGPIGGIDAPLKAAAPYETEAQRWKRHAHFTAVG